MDYATLQGLIATCRGDDQPAEVGVLLDFLEENEPQLRNAAETLRAATKAVEELRERAALTIRIDVPPNLVRYGERYSLRVDFTADAFEHDFFTRGVGNVSSYARHVGRDVGEKVERALVDWISRRERPGR